MAISEIFNPKNAEKITEFLRSEISKNQKEHRNFQEMRWTFLLSKKKKKQRINSRSELAIPCDFVLYTYYVTN